MKVITSSSNQKVKEIKKLRHSKYRRQKQLFIVETLHLIEEAKKSNKLVCIITDDLDYQSEVETIYVSDNVMKTLSSFKNATHYLGVVKLLDNAIDYSKDIIVLDNIQDPGNLGTILRNALAFDCQNIVLGLDCVDLYNEKVIQASQGAIFALNIESHPLLEFIYKLKKENYELIGTALTNAKALNKTSALTRKTALFFGNEGKGLKKEILTLLDYNYFIPIKNIDSLNVAGASAIVFYQLFK